MITQSREVKGGHKERPGTAKPEGVRPPSQIGGGESEMRAAAVPGELRVAWSDVAAQASGVRFYCAVEFCRLAIMTPKGDQRRPELFRMGRQLFDHAIELDHAEMRAATGLGSPGKP